MYSLYASLIAFAVASLLVAKLEKKPILLLLSAGLVLGSIAGYVTAFLLSAFVPMKEVTYPRAILAAMRSDVNHSRTFLLGTGSESGHVVYRFFIRNQDGSLTPYEIQASPHVRIIEDATLTNQGHWSTTMKEVDKSAAIAAWAIRTSVTDPVVVKEEFRVPQGTVVQSFTVR